MNRFPLVREYRTDDIDTSSETVEYLVTWDALGTDRKSVV